MKLNYIERMTRYNELKRDYDLQCIENGKKQEQILELRRTKRELEEKVEKLEEKLKASDLEYDKLIQSLAPNKFEEVANDRKHNTTKQAHSKRASR